MRTMEWEWVNEWMSEWAGESGGQERGPGVKSQENDIDLNTKRTSQTNN